MDTYRTHFMADAYSMCFKIKIGLITLTIYFTMYACMMHVYSILLYEQQMYFLKILIQN